MRRWLQIAAILTLAWPTTGCVMAVRHFAKEANRSSFQDKGRARFPVGTSIDKARSSLTAAGYRCLDISQHNKTPAHVSCSPTAHQTAGLEKFLIGGDWRWDLYGNGDSLTKVHIASAGRGIRRQNEQGTKTMQNSTYAPLAPT